jgi:hypothetical protein
MAGPNFPAHLDAVAVGQPDVEDRHIRLGRWDPRQGLLGRPGLSDDLEPAGGFEQVPEAAANHLVIIEQENAHSIAQEVPS